MKKGLIGFIIGAIIFGCIGVYAAVTYNAEEIKYKNKTVKEALDDLYSGNTVDLSLAPWEYPYIGAIQQFKAPLSGKYKLETWGAQGGIQNDTLYGGYGAYAKGEYELESGEILYIVVGEHGKVDTTLTSGTYNGGGAGSKAVSSKKNWYSSGGGATYIGFEKNVIAEIKDKSKIILVAAGGGGATYWDSTTQYNCKGGHGGGVIGIVSNCLSSSEFKVMSSATQEIGGKFEYYVNGFKNEGTFGQGAAWYGGGGSGYYGGAGSYSGSGGGSSFINNQKLSNKEMYAYCNESDCSKYASDEEATKTIITTNVSENPVSNSAKKGHGYAKITYIGK